MELAPFGGDTPEGLLFFPLCKHQGKAMWAQKGPSRTQPCWHPDLQLQPQNLEEKFLLPESPSSWYFVTAAPRLGHSLKTAYGFIMRSCTKWHYFAESEIWLFISTWSGSRLVLLIYHPNFLKG